MTYILHHLELEIGSDFFYPKLAVAIVDHMEKALPVAIARIDKVAFTIIDFLETPINARSNFEMGGHSSDLHTFIEGINFLYYYFEFY